MTNRTVQSKFETLLFLRKHEDFEYVVEYFEARLQNLKLRIVFFVQESLPDQTAANFAVSKTS